HTARFRALIAPRRARAQDSINGIHDTPLAKTGNAVWNGELRRHLLLLGSRFAEIHQFPDGSIFEPFNALTPLELLDRDLADESVIGAVETDQPSDNPLEKRRALGEDGLQNGRLALE